MKKKSIKVNKIIALSIIIVFLSFARTASADFEIIPKPEEAFYMYVIDINNNGEVLGVYWIPPENGYIGEYRVFIWSNGEMETLESGGWNTTVAWDFNDEGDVVGFYGNLTEEFWLEDETPCLWLRNVGLIDITPVLPEGGGVMAINNQIHMAGGRWTEDPLSWGERAFLLKFLEYEIIEIGTLWTRDDGYGFSTASAVNENDQVVGDSDAGDFTIRAYRWTLGEEGMINLGILSGYQASSASGINNNGDVIGTCYNEQCTPLNGDEYCWPENHRAFLYPNDVGEMIDLGMLPERTISEPRGINDNKLIVGLCANETGEPFLWEDQIAFIWREGEMFPLSEIIGVPNIMIAEGINNQGEITGMAFNSDSGEDYCFLWTPYFPVADAGDDLTIAAGDDDCLANVTLDGSGSSDPDSTPGTNDDIVSFDWYDEDNILLGSGEILEHTFPYGEHMVTLLTTDKFWQTNDDVVSIVVQDSTPPDISVTITPDILWPPDLTMIEVLPSIQTSDVCCGSDVTVELVDIQMNEGDTENTFDPSFDIDPDSGHIGDDIQIIDGRIFLRAERAGNSSGRVYTLTYRATDCAGNTATATGTVTVPHDRR